MADFDYEQLKTLFEGLSNRLDKTKGDAEVASQISDMKKQIGDLLKKIDDKKDKKEQITDKDIKNLIDELVSGVENAFKETAKKQQAADAKNADDIKKSLDKLAENKSNSDSSQGMLNIGLDAAGKSSSKFSKFLDKATDKIGVADRIIGGTTSRLLNMDGTVSGLAEAFGVTSSTVLALTRHFDNEVGAFRDLQSTSEGSIRTISDMHVAMNDAMMTSRELADSMRQGSDGARVFGAIEWSTLAKNVRNATRDVGFFGYSLTDLTDAQSEYLDLLKNRGDIFNLDQKDITNQLVKLLSVNDKMAMILGKNRDEVLAERSKKERDVSVDTYYRGLSATPEQKDALDTLSQLGDNLGISQLIKQRATHTALDENTQLQYSMMTPEMRNMIDTLTEGVRTGTMSSEEILKLAPQFRDFAEQYDRDNKLQEQNIGQLGVMNAAPQGYLDFATFIQKSLGLGKPGERGKENMPTTPEEMDQPTLNALKMQEVTKQVQMNSIMTLDKMLDEAAGKFSESIGSTIDGLHSFNTGINDVVSHLDSLSSAMGAFGLLVGATSLFSSIPGLLITMKALKGGAKVIGNVLATGAKGVTGVASTVSGATKAAGTAAEASTAAKTAGSAASSADDALSSVSKAAKIAGKLKFLGSALAVTAEGATAYSNITDAKAKKDAGQLTDDEYQKIFTEEIAKAVGGSGGSILLGSLGATLGAGAGSMVAPGPGTLVGGVAGGIGGGVAGMFGGEAAGKYIGSQLYDLMKDDSPPEVQPTEPPEPAQLPQRQVTDIQDSLSDIQSSQQPIVPPDNAITPSEAVSLDKFGQQQKNLLSQDGLKSSGDQQKPNISITPDDFKQPIEDLQRGIENSLSKNDESLGEIKELLKSLIEELHSGNVLSQDKLNSIATAQERLNLYLRTSIVQ